MMILALTLAFQTLETAPAIEADQAADPIAALLETREPASLSQAQPQTGCVGEFTESHFIACQYGPGSRINLGGIEATGDVAGWAVLALPRQTETPQPFRVELADGTVIVDEVREIGQRDYALQRVNGVPGATVNPDPSTLPRRQREYAQKQEAFNSVWDGVGYLDGFVEPSQGVMTGVFGSARIYNDGAERGVHWGIDWANQTGTPVVAPAGGLVTLAEADMYYEGGLIFIDHGQGVVSAFLHLSAVHVETGQIVEQGELIGDIGAGGRSTGPHLDWRVKLRNQFYADPQTLLDLDIPTE
ncbi:M23 family metallopeptidase [Maricaulis sp. D1M11]|uniref:M23 family metallopeptidase n=1 Tax=Maricaulis sp. D1M11 TaxID=3076117 RepID=UPI0039B6CF15